MFDLRYHVASLAAVFLALIIGILVGVGISSQTDVEASERRVLEERIADLEQRLQNATVRMDLLRRQQEAASGYVEESYPAVMNGRLRGTRVAVLFVGRLDEDGLATIEQTLADASGPAAVRVRALHLPIDGPAVTDALGPELEELTLEDLGRRLGGEFVTGGETPAWDALERVIVDDRQGSIGSEADAVVVSHTARIDESATARLVAGIYAGLAASGVPAVGVERTDAQPSRITVYRRNRLSSVDSVETEIGRVALALLLAGGPEGHYGVKETAEDGPLAPIEPLTLAPASGD